jgi:glyoxylase-like metal-dependent hydrolase (beta-lactamase superfamily II)
MEKIANIYRIHHDLPFPGLESIRLPAAMHCIQDDAGLVLIDPFVLADEETRELEALGKPAYVLITNLNHDRDAEHYRHQYGAMIMAHPSLAGYFDFALDSAFENGDQLPGGLTAIGMPGTFKGETIFLHPEQGGSLIVGDAIMNLSLKRYGVAGAAMKTMGWSEGVGTMPRLMMKDELQADASYRRLLCGSFSRILMTHGTPIHAQAKGTLLKALNNNYPVLPYSMRRVVSKAYNNLWELVDEVL